MSEVWSCGGGVQSSAIAALIVEGLLPTPDVAVIADTGREASETWRYCENVLQPALAAVGVDLVRLPHSFEGTGWNTVDLFGGADGRTALMPMYTAAGAGQVSKYCSNEWKSRPVDRYLRHLKLTGGRLWIGFSIDEIHRMRSNDPKAKWNHHYPLVDKRMTRGDCIALVERHGWPTPPRSSCWMCPYRSDEEWRHLKETDPDDFRQAIELEQVIRGIDPNLYLHRSGEPLWTVDLKDDTGDLFDSCGSGHCFT